MTGTAETSPTNPLLNLEQAALMIGVSGVTLRRWSKKGAFPEPVVLGKALRWPLSDIQKFLADKGPANATN